MLAEAKYPKPHNKKAKAASIVLPMFHRSGISYTRQLPPAVAVSIDVDKDLRLDAVRRFPS